FLSLRRSTPTISTLFPYTTLFRSQLSASAGVMERQAAIVATIILRYMRFLRDPYVSGFRGKVEAGVAAPIFTPDSTAPDSTSPRSEEHTSELQSRVDLVCRLLLEK